MLFAINGNSVYTIIYNITLYYAKYTSEEIIMAECSFWGCDNCDVKPVSHEYIGIESPADLYRALENIWCAKTCAPRMRSEWTEENKTLGQCSITSFLVQDIFGGKVYGVPLEGGGYHCYNAVGSAVFDLTSEQFGDEKLVYALENEQLREQHFADEEKKARYEYLKEKLSGRQTC